jgi:transcriptional regulator with XRE-family HTH domain
MQKSSITKLQRRRAFRERGPDTDFARGLGNAIRDRRRARGLTQSQLGHPLTKGYVSEVERGHSLPSLRALAFIADRLDVPVGELLQEVKAGLPSVYTPADENQHAAAASRH